MKNHIGEKHGRLTILEFLYKKNSHYYYKCKCDCGNEKVINYCSMKTGTVKSCGCYQKEIYEQNKLRFAKMREDNVFKKKLSAILRGMRQRCYNMKDPHYKNYGAKGITICDEWMSEDGVNNFYEWAIQNGYKIGLSIDRINVYGNYEPENCKWSTSKEQNNNRTNNIKVIYNGKTYLINDIVEICNVKRRTIASRIGKGLCFEDIIYEGHLAQRKK